MISIQISYMILLPIIDKEAKNLEDIIENILILSILFQRYIENTIQ